MKAYSFVAVVTLAIACAPVAAAAPVHVGGPKGLLLDFLTSNIGAPRAGTLEVLDRDTAGKPTLARLALGHSLPCLWEQGLGMGGTWAYLISDGPGVMVCDAGPRYPLGWSVIPLSGFKKWLPPLTGTQHLIAAVDKLFPGRKVTTILVMHWHPDHSEAAPDLQAACFKHYGLLPPLRIRGVDRPAHGHGPLSGGAEAVFLAAGYAPGSWTWGPDLRANETLGQTGYKVLPLPGHTLGTIALINDKRRIALGPTPHYGEGLATESPQSYRASMLTFYQATYGFKHYASHPVPEIKDDWPVPPWGLPTKKPASRP
jgi:glyoxylase-like metal-dependent hydrolase (beta-lactamase superfamily II)